MPHPIPSSPHAVREASRADHDALDRLFAELTEAFGSDVPTEHARLWSALDERLRAHMELEEQYLLPRLALSHPDEARALRAEHDELRRLLLELGVGVDLHTTRADAVERFVAVLRGHARREDALLYRWADDTLMPRERDELVQRIRATPTQA
jgi:iron-sulfur cluster repair protein YtfE (RIC family)